MIMTELLHDCLIHITNFRFLSPRPDHVYERSQRGDDKVPPFSMFSSMCGCHLIRDLITPSLQFARPGGETTELRM